VEVAPLRRFDFDFPTNWQNSLNIHFSRFSDGVAAIKPFWYQTNEYAVKQMMVPQGLEKIKQKMPGETNTQNR